MIEIFKGNIVQISLLAIVVTGSVFLVIEILGMVCLSIMAVVLLSVFVLLRRRWQTLRQKGLINLCSPRLRAFLLQRSILDVIRDLIYFPYVTRILGVFIKVAASKPHPAQVSNLLKQLPKQVSQVVNSKGILSLAPSVIEDMLLPLQNREVVSRQYGMVDEKWDHLEEYQRKEERVHEETMQHRVVHFLDGRVGWPTALGLVVVTVVGAAHMNPKRLRRMIIQNVTFLCMFFAVITMLVKIRKAVRHKKAIRLKSQAIQQEEKEE